MTNRRDFKALVRSRMEKTGERYTTARAQLLASHEPPAAVEPMFGGAQPDLAAARNFCTRHGVHGPDGQPLTEAMAFGLAGGVGFLYGVFEYGDQPTMTIVGRNRSMPDPFVEPLFGRVGLDVEVATTTSAAKAARTLDAQLDGGDAVLCTVGAGGLGYLGLPTGDASMSPHVVGVVGREGDDVLIDDRTPAPHIVRRAELDHARGLYKQAKHRLVMTTGSASAVDWDTTIRRAVREGAELFDQPPVPQFASNVGLRGLRKWARLLTDRSDKKGWPTVFGATDRAALGLTRVVEGIDHEYTSPSASRPLHARFLREAASETGEGSWTEAADLFDRSAAAWSEIVATIAAAHPDLARFVAHAEDRAAQIDAGPDADEMARLRAAQEEAVASCDISADDAAEVFGALATLVTSIADAEEAALDIVR